MSSVEVEEATPEEGRAIVQAAIDRGDAPWEIKMLAPFCPDLAAEYLATV